jgi:exopolyphosphatase / guanosine-5'-triphosphate,3'-diphosphate pyrophosphatase
MSTTVVPRWEWRAFGRSFGPAEERFGEQTPERVQESDELYLLSKTVDENVKVRDGLLDVKELEHVNADGLEQWVPVLKEPFPLAATTAAAVLERLAVSSPPVERNAYTLDEFVRELVVPSAELLAVQVHKRRQRYTIGGCMAELTDLRTDAGESRTVAVESEDADRVIATVRHLGLASTTNTSFPRGLKALALGSQ